jgi:hypothetical protein
LDDSFRIDFVDSVFTKLSLSFSTPLELFEEVATVLEASEDSRFTVRSAGTEQLKESSKMEFLSSRNSARVDFAASFSGSLVEVSFL